MADTVSDRLATEKQLGMLIVVGERGIDELLALVRAHWAKGEAYYLDGRITFRPEPPALTKLGAAAPLPERAIAQHRAIDDLPLVRGEGHAMERAGMTDFSMTDNSQTVGREVMPRMRELPPRTYAIHARAEKRLLPNGIAHP